MSKHNWHIARVNESPKKIRHYKFLTKMFDFVLRNPAMFKGRDLVIYDHNEKIRTVTYEVIAEIVSKNLKETEVRKLIRR